MRVDGGRVSSGNQLPNDPPTVLGHGMFGPAGTSDWSATATVVPGTDDLAGAALLTHNQSRG